MAIYGLFDGLASWWRPPAPRAQYAGRDAFARQAFADETCLQASLRALCLCIALALSLGALPGHAQNSPATDDFLYAQKLFTEGYYELCLAQLEAFRQRHPEAQETAEAWRLSGEANFILRRYEAAARDFRTFEVRYPFHQNVEEARFKLAESYEAHGRLPEAAQAFERVAAYHPGGERAPRAQYRAGALWHQLGEAEKARADLYAVLENHPHSEQRLPAHLLLVENFMAAGEQARALQEADRLFRSFPPAQLTAQAYFIRGRAQEQVGQLQLAEESYLELLKKFPREAWAGAAHARLAELQFARGEVPAAVSSLEQAAAVTARREAKNLFALRAAEMQMSVGKTAEASAALQKFEEIPADSAANLVYHFMRGQLAEKTAQPAQAAQAYQRATLFSRAAESRSDSAKPAPVHPRQRSFWRGAQVLCDSKDYAPALKLIRQYRGEYPQGRFQDAMLFLEARIQKEGNGDLTQAQRRYDELLHAFPASAFIDDAQFELAQIYEALGEWQVARWQWQRFLQLYPASEYAAAARARLRLLQEFTPTDSPASMTHITSVLMKMQTGTPREEVLLALARLHFERHEFEQALHYCRPLLSAETTPEIRQEAQYLAGASYYSVGEAERLRGRAAQAWRDSAGAVLQTAASAEANPRFASAAEILLARLEFVPPPEPDAATLGRADALLQRHADEPALDEVRLWAAAARINLAPGDTAAHRQALHSLQQVAARDSSLYRNQALLMLAQQHWQRGDTSAAQNALAQLEVSKINDVHQAQGQLLKARWLAAQKKYPPAIATLQALRERHFYSAYFDSAQALLLRVYILSGQTQEALRALEMADDPAGFNDGLALTRAQVLESAGNYSRAIQAYLRFLETHPGAPEAAPALLAAARLTRRAGADQLALGYYEECMRRFPGTDYSHEARLRQAEMLFDRNDFVNARPLFLEAYNEKPNGPFAKEALKKFVLCLYKTKNIAQADIESRKFEELYKNDRESMAEIQYAAGEVALENKDFAAAERIFKKLRDYRDTPSGILGEYGLGKTLLIQTKTEEALETLTGIPRRYPNNPFLPTVYLGLGDFYQNQKQFDNAIAAFNKVVQDSSFDKNYRLAVRSLIDVYDRINLKDRALALARHYVTRFPDDAKTIDLQIKIGMILIDLAQFDDAIAQLKRLKPFADAATEPEIQYYIGKSHMNAGRFELAVSELLRVKFFSQPGKLPWDVIALYDSAICYMRLNNCAMARKLFQQIVREQGAASEFGRFANAKIAELGACAQMN